MESASPTFTQRLEPFRGELQLHCYRILGSLQDAEDQVQETLLAAWRAQRTFEERSSLRTWLYRIATNRCLNALRDRGRRPQELTMDLPEPTRRGEPVHLQPLPDAWLQGVPDAAPGPDARYELRESVGLAFLMALHLLPPQQRAALVLRDVLGFRATEVAAMLDTTEASAKSALQRARATVAQRAPSGEHAAAARSAPEAELVARFAAAVERGDTDGVVSLLTDDAWLTMPPAPHEYQGHAAIAAFLADRQERRGVPLVVRATRANGQPALGCYVPDAAASVARPYGMLVLTPAPGAFSAITFFMDATVLPFFGLPAELAAPR